MKRVLIALGALVAGMTLAMLTSQGAVAQQDTCPEGNGWIKVNSGNLSEYPVAGATQYCFKASNYILDAIPNGGFGQEGACEATHPERCDLSHWSYFIPVSPSSTPTPTSTPTTTPTLTPTNTPSVTPTIGVSKISKTFMCYDSELGSYWRIRNDGGVVSGTITWKINQSALTDIGSLNPGEARFFYTKTCGVLTVYENGVSKGTATCSKEKLCEEKPTPTPTEVATPTPTPSEPTVTPTPGKGKVAGLGYEVTCDKDEVSAKMHFTNDGEPMEGVKTTFDYNGNKKEATSNSNGYAIAVFPKDGENLLVATTDGFDKIQTKVQFPDCPATGGGEVLGATTGSRGQVLGATTYASTGVGADMLMQLSGVLGTLMVSAGALMHAKQK